jgi:hypothetical protein
VPPKISYDWIEKLQPVIRKYNGNKKHNFQNNLITIPRIQK